MSPASSSVIYKQKRSNQSRKHRKTCSSAPHNKQTVPLLGQDQQAQASALQRETRRTRTSTNSELTLHLAGIANLSSSAPSRQYGREERVEAPPSARRPQARRRERAEAIGGTAQGATSVKERRRAVTTLAATRTHRGKHGERPGSVCGPVSADRGKLQQSTRSTAEHGRRRALHPGNAQHRDRDYRRVSRRASLWPARPR